MSVKSWLLALILLPAAAYAKEGESPYTENTVPAPVQDYGNLKLKLEPGAPRSGC
jgi:UDP-glucose 4-epimerase